MNGNREILGTIKSAKSVKSKVLGLKCSWRPFQPQDVSLTGQHLNKEIKNICRRICSSIREMKKWRNREAIATK
jgi:hypothetical protein